MTVLMVSSTNDMALRTGDGTSFGRITGITNNPSITNAGYILKGTQMVGDILTTPRVGEQWLKVTIVGGIVLATPGFVAYKIGTVTYCALSEITPPPVGGNLEIISVTLTPHYSDGSTGIPTDYIEKV